MAKTLLRGIRVSSKEELAQRLSLELTTVSIDPAFDVNKWTLGFGRDYGARADPNDFSLLYSYLEEELTSARPFDAILIQLSHGWDALTPNSREALLRRVREGAGLVLIRPGDDQISPLGLSAPVSPPTRFRGVEIPSSPASSWKRTAPHYITRAIPVESFPFEYLQEYGYKPASAAEVLIQSGAGNPILAVRPFGKGRVVAFGYDNTGLAWSMSMSASGFVSDLYWEYFYAMLCRSLIFAADREPAASFTPALWRLKSFDGTVIRSGKGKPPSFSKLGPGRYFVEEQSETDWNVSAIDVPQPLKIEGLKSSLEIIREGDSVEASWNPLPEPAVAELVDGLGRVIALATSVTNKVAFKAGHPLTHSGFLRVAAGSATAQVPVQFAASSREWSDYEIIMPWYGPRGYHPWIPALDEQFRKVGVTTLVNPGRNFRLIASAGLHDIFGVYGYRDQNYRKRKAAYAETKDKAHLTRDVILQSPGFEADLRRQMTERLARLGPLAYYIADESSLTSYTDPFDVDWSPDSLAAFRQWLQKEYPSLDALNTSWGTTFSAGRPWFP